MSTDQNIVTLHLIIHGRVQGVCFRDSLRREAQKLSLTGWVRNCTNGTVEATIQGKSCDVNTMVNWAQHGPELAQVERVDSEVAVGDYKNFSIL